MTPGILGILAALGLGLGVYDAPRLSRGVRTAGVVLAAVVILALCAVARDRETPFDLSVFYCAGHAVLAHAPPQYAASLEACERQLITPLDAVAPAPQPGYDLAAFALLARLPFAWADALWYLAVAAALAISTIALRRITQIPAITLVAAQALTLGVTSIELGQLAPFVFAFVALAALGLVERRPRLAGIAAAAALILPHAGLPLVAAVAIVAPRARGAIAISCVVLGGIALATLGFGGNLDYVTRELPLQALAESANVEQFSFTMLAHVAGENDVIAGRLGLLSYAVMLVAGIWLGIRAARRSGDPSFAAFVPVAAVLVGGTYVHASQIPLALGAALVLAARREAVPRIAGRAAVVLLALPFNTPPYRLLFAVASVVVVAIVLGLPPPATLRTRLAACVLTVAAYVGALVGISHLPGRPIRIASDVASFRESTRPLAAYASTQWGVMMRSEAKYTDSSVRILVSKLPVWLALALILYGAGSVGTGGGMKLRSSAERSKL